RPSREMQLMISQQLGLDPTTVANFFMNARRRGHDRQPTKDEPNQLSSSASNESRTATTTPSSVASGNESDYCSSSLSELQAQVQQVVQQVQAQQLAEQQRKQEKQTNDIQDPSFNVLEDDSSIVKTEDFLEDDPY